MYSEKWSNLSIDDLDDIDDDAFDESIDFEDQLEKLEHEEMLMEWI